MDKNVIKGLGEALSSLRKEKMKTLKDLSTITSLSVSYISAIEHGRKTPDLQVVERIATALKTPLYLLLFKAAIEEQVSPERRRLVRDFKPILKKMEQLAKELYDNDDDDDADSEENITSPDQPKHYQLEEYA